MMLDEIEEFGAGAGVVAECAEHGGGEGVGILFFDAAHGHAEVLGFDDNGDAEGFDEFVDHLGDFGGHAFLHLKTTGEDFDQPGKFGKADNFGRGKIRDVALAEKGEEVMFAEAVKVDVLDDDHFVGFHVEEGVIEHLFGIDPITAGEELVGFGDAHGGAEKAVAGGVFAD